MVLSDFLLVSFPGAMRESMSCVSITLLEKQGLLLDSSLTINHNNPGGTGRLFADVAADAFPPDRALTSSQAVGFRRDTFSV